MRAFATNVTREDVKAVLARGPHTTAQLMDRLGLSRTTTLNHLKALRERGDLLVDETEQPPTYRARPTRDAA